LEGWLVGFSEGSVDGKEVGDTVGADDNVGE